MGLYRVHREVEQKDHWVIAPGPACAIMIAVKSWAIPRSALLCVYDVNNNFEGLWSAA